MEHLEISQVNETNRRNVKEKIEILAPSKKMQDSLASWIPFCQWIPDSLSAEINGFQISIVSGIPDSKA